MKFNYGGGFLLRPSSFFGNNRFKYKSLVVDAKIKPSPHDIPGPNFQKEKSR